MERPMIFGTETEYGITAPQVEGFDPVSGSIFLINQLPPDLAGPRLQWDYENENPLVDARGFTVEGEREVPPPEENAVINKPLPNGGRLYVDGAHPEYSTPECTHPLEVVAHERAGNAIVYRCLEAANRIRKPGEDLRLYRNNTDGKGNSYGYHENYLVPREIPFDQLVKLMVPFLVTRQIFAGAGKVGAENRTEETTYQISQRADFFECLLDLNTMAKRPIINTRDEPHGDPRRFRRFHVIVGDANMADLSTYLKVGTTALVLRSLEEGAWREEMPPALEDPVRAIKEISRDLTLKRPVRLENGSTMTALEIQRYYLERLHRFYDQTSPSPVVKEILSQWEWVLDQLEKGPETLERDLDWVIKWRLLDSYCSRKGCDWKDPRVSLMDLQYHDLRPSRGLYYKLLREGYVRTLVPEDRVQEAIQVPPPETRAYFRGMCIQRYPGEVYGVSWTSVLFDLGQDTIKRVPLMDPRRGTRNLVEGLLDQAPSAKMLLEMLSQTAGG